MHCNPGPAPGFLSLHPRRPVERLDASACPLTARSRHRPEKETPARGRGSCPVHSADAPKAPEVG